MDVNRELNWDRVAAFVRQHTHDVRNHLNALDLEAALLAELVTDPEASVSVTRLRRQIREAAAGMRALSAKFAEPRATGIPISARVLLEIWKEQHAAIEAAPTVDWQDRLGSERVSVDPEAMSEVFRELLVNAMSFQSRPPLTVSAGVTEDSVTLSLGEPKDAEVQVEDWGRRPFFSTRRGSYGLGLWTIERRVLAHGGSVQRQFDPTTRELVTTLRLPIVDALAPKIGS